MKTIELKEGQTARIIGGKIIIEDAFEPKEGDFITTRYGDYVQTFILRGEYKGENRKVKFFAGLSDGYVQTNSSIGTVLKRTDTYATEAEKQQLLDALDKKGLRWNAEEKQVEKKRWRAKKEEYYWYVSDRFVSKCSTESQDTIAKDRFDVGNYFQTKEDSDAFATKVRELYSQNLK